MEKKPFIPHEGKGRIFPNRRKESNSHPDLRGDAMVNGVHVEIAGWNQDDGSISLSIQKKQDRPQGQQSGGSTFYPDRNTKDVPLPKARPNVETTPAIDKMDNDSVPF